MYTCPWDQLHTKVSVHSHTQDGQAFDKKCQPALQSTVTSLNKMKKIPKQPHNGLFDLRKNSLKSMSCTVIELSMVTTITCKTHTPSAVSLSVSLFCESQLHMAL